MEKVFFATGNTGKIEEMSPIFEQRGFELEQVEVDIEEIQAIDVEKVAERKVRDSFMDAGVDAPVIVEDTGFFVEALEGFPGAMASFFHGSVGASGLLKLLEDRENRKAYFKTAVGFYDGEQLKVFTGRVDGEIPVKKRGEPHPYMPYDSFFIPEGEDESFAENNSLKEKYSHRGEVTRAFIEWLDSEY